MQNNPEIERENINRFRCLNCGSNMVFNPEKQMLTCFHCESSQAIEATGEQIQKRSYEMFLTPEAFQLQPMATEAMQVSCQSCGATINFTPPETARECDFCGSKIVAQPKSADPLIAPEAVLPLKVSKDEAKKALSSWLGSLWFAPSALKTMAQADKLHSVYLPFWAYDAFTTSQYTGSRGVHYYETETYYENGEERQRQVRRTNWFPVSGTVQRQFVDVSIPATKSLSEEYLQRLHWDLPAILPYNPAYLSGHKAQTYQVNLEEGFGIFKELSKSTIYSDVTNDIGGDEQQVHHLATDYSNIAFNHLLLPVYAGAYRFNGKVYQIVVNGRSGEVQGERPYSWLKIGCLVFFIIAFILLIILIFSMAR
jgi:DNA-directed RNA polymerase subunit RPC12/RpoP